MKKHFPTNRLAARLAVLVLCLVVGLPSIGLADEFGDAKKAYQRGQNDEALRLLIVKLRKDNDHQDAIALFKTVVKVVINKHQTAAEDSASMKSWDAAYADYEYLRRLGDDLAAITPLEEVKVNGKKEKKPIAMPVIDVRVARQNALTNAAETHYQRGIAQTTAMGGAEGAVAEFDAARNYIPDYKDSRQRAAEALYRDGLDLRARKDFKQATRVFNRIQNYVPGYKDSAGLAYETRQAALQRIAFLPFSNLSGKYQFGELGQILSDRAVSMAMDRRPEFVEFVTREYLGSVLQEHSLIQAAYVDESSAARVGKLAGLHTMVVGKVLSITVFNPSEMTERGTSTKTITKDGVKSPIKATWIKHTLQGYVEITGSFQIVDVEKGTIIKSETITRRTEDRAQWVTFSGDEAAMTPDVKAHQTTGRRPLDSVDQMARAAIERIAADVASSITQFFQ